MGRLGDHPNIVTVFDLGDESGQPYMVLPLLPGGDVEGLIEKAPEHRLPLEQALQDRASRPARASSSPTRRASSTATSSPATSGSTADGRAKIGDFGLAVAVDRSRLTQAGMMVGTVSLHAAGAGDGRRGDAALATSTRLGAMLYEMVCGRPPFVGDESVAIIGQHLNTPPVAPSWHRPDCPPGLEALILRLLEKDPSKRPASAAEVREALQAVASEPEQPTVAAAGRVAARARPALPPHLRRPRARS